MQKQIKKNKKRNALGQGLSMLLGPDLSAAEGREEKGFLQVDIDLVRANPMQPRKKFDESAITELSNSIKQHGIISPIVVSSVQNGLYEVIAGERRLRAAKAAGLITVPVVVRNTKDAGTMECALIENIQRENLTAIEEARGYMFLADKYGYTQDRLAHAVGKSRSHVSNIMRLLDLPVEIHDMINDGLISMGHARAIIKSSDQLGAARVIVEKSLSVRQAEQIISKQNNKIVRNRETSTSSCVTEIEDMISKKVGAAVRIDNNSIVIIYKDLVDLDRIVSALCA